MIQNTSNFDFENGELIPQFEKTEKFNSLKDDEFESSSNDLSESNWSSNLKEKYIESPSVNVFDVAAYILKKLGQMTTMKLQKLVYYCQVWSLVWDEKPLFTEPIEAWANGPVVKNLFSFHRGLYSISSIPIGNPGLLNDIQKETIDIVLDFYGEKSSQWLIDLTHIEDPWKNARSGLQDSERGSREIKHGDIAEYYSSLPPAR